VFVLALLALVVPAAARACRALRVRGDGDRAAAVLALAVRGLPAGRADWGRAMVAELDAARGPRERRRFSRGCARAVAVMRLRAALGGPHRDGAGVRAVVLAAAAAALALAGYGLIRYPLLRADAGARVSVVVLLAVLLGYAVCAIGLSRGTTAAAAGARRLGLLGGLAVGAAWLMVAFPTPSLKAWVAAPLLVAVLAPAGVAVLAGRASGDARAATAAALWCGLVGGLLVFVVWVTATYLQDGGPFDPQLIRDFHASGARDLTTYAVGDNLGGALGMLVIVPVVALAFGSLAARSPSRRVTGA
jgi:hypothetical protein